MQALCQKLGKSGCYFFCLLKIARYDGDPIALAFRSIKEGWLRADMYVLNPDKILQACGSDLHIIPERAVKTGQEVIAHVPNFGGHFVVVDDNGIVIYDPLHRLDGSSPIIDSWRNFVR